MTANPAALQPVIVEMQPPPSTATGTPNLARASDALDLLRTNGRAVGGLAIIDSAAGFADANGINAISLVPAVAYFHYDATVLASIDPLPTPTPLPTPVALPTPTPVLPTPPPLLPTP